MSNVFFIDAHAKSSSENILNKLEKLMVRAELKNYFSPNDIVGIKIHFGEYGNLSTIRPAFLGKIVSFLKKECNIKPFLTDTNTLYRGSRRNAVDHILTALKNGYSYATVLCPCIIADGLHGLSYEEVEISGELLDKVEIAGDIFHADALLVVTHFKCHELSGFGGSIKNLGMGCSSRKGKLKMHSSIRPKVKKGCILCKKCAKVCPADAISFDSKAIIDSQKCVGCGDCIVVCPENVIQINWDATPNDMQKKMAEYALGAVANKRQKVYFLNFILDVSPLCDCYGYNDIPIVPDIGILASADPVAIDKASYDLVNQAPWQHGCGFSGKSGSSKFKVVHPKVNPLTQLYHAQKIGLGEMDYNLIHI